MSDLRNVKEINVVHNMDYANRHLASGWILIAVNSYSAGTRGDITTGTDYVLGWEDALPSKDVSYYADDE